MILVTYNLSSPVSARQFRESELCGEGRTFSDNVLEFGEGRSGDYRVSLTDYWGVMYFHANGRVDIEIDHIPDSELTDLLREVADRLFVSMRLVQPLRGLPHLPLKVEPNEARDKAEH